MDNEWLYFGMGFMGGFYFAMFVMHVVERKKDNG